MPNCEVGGIAMMQGVEAIAHVLRQALDDTRFPHATKRNVTADDP